MDPRFVIVLAVFSYTLNMYLKRISAYSNPSTMKVNCLQYDLKLRTPMEDALYWTASKVDPILNIGNIQPYVYSESVDCESMVKVILAVNRDRPLTSQIFSTVFGLKPEFKIVVSEKLPKIGDAAQYSKETDTLLIAQHIAAFPPGGSFSSMHSSNIIRNKFMHIFIDLHARHFGDNIWSSYFNQQALAQFEAVKARLKKILIESENPGDVNKQIQVDGPFSDDIYDLGDFVNRINLIQSTLYKHSKDTDAQRVKLIFAHLIQYFPEEVIAEFYPLYYQQIKVMIARFDKIALQPHRGKFPNLNSDYGYLVQNAECFVFGRDLSTDEIENLGAKVADAIESNDEAYIKNQISQFENEEWKCALNRLKEPHPKAYGQMHLIMGKCYHFLNEYRDANRHFSKAWHQKVDFSDVEIRAHYESAKWVGHIEGSLQCAYNATEPEDVDQTIHYRYK